MIKLSVLYGKPTDTAAFDEHYRSVHAPLARAIPGLKRFEYGTLSTLDGSEPPFYLMANLWFDDMEAFGAGMSSPEGAAAGDDVPKFATGGATLAISEVEPDPA